MIITDSFVMLNLPKTGSTFARTVIKEIHANRLSRQSFIIRGLQKLQIVKSPVCREILLPNIKVKRGNIEPDQHGTYSQIPNEYRHLPVFSIVRNPYSRFMSGYEFRWWEKYPPINDELLAEHFPRFPDLSVDDIVRLNDLDVIYNRFDGNAPKAEVGIQTIQFIQMFFRDPKEVLQDLTDEYLDSTHIFDDVAEISFLRQENLNKDLAHFLSSVGYSADEVNYVKSRDRVNVTEARSSNRNTLWTPTALSYVRIKERMIFRLLEAKGIIYKEPNLNNSMDPL